MVAVISASPKAVVVARMLIISGWVCKFDLDYVSEIRGKLLVAISLGDVWDISRIRLSGQSVLASYSRSEDCAKRVRV